MKGRFVGNQPHQLESHSACMAAALHRCGVPFGAIATQRGAAREVWLAFAAAGRHWFFRYGQLRVADRPAFAASRHINGQTAAVTTSKRATKKLLADAGIPVAPGRAFDARDRAGALAWFERLGGEACVKPDGGTQGQGLTTHVGDPEAFKRAFTKAATGFGAVMVERMLEGEVIRVLCLDGRAVATRLDRRPSVLGDGAASVRVLIAAKNAERARRKLPGYVPLSLNDTARFYLSRQGLDADAVPESRQRVWLSGSSHPNQGGDVISGPPELHDSHVRLVEEACRALPGLRMAGYDLLVGDRRRPGDARVLEVNSSPGLAYFHHPWRGPAQDAAGCVVDWILAGA